MSRIGQTKIEELMGACFDRAGECEGCVFAEFCDQNEFESKPKDWFCADPPRFTEAQMAFWKALYDLGARKITACFNDDDSSCGWETNNMNGHKWSYISISDDMSETIGLKVGETLDLAELFGTAQCQ